MLCKPLFAQHKSVPTFVLESKDMAPTLLLASNSPRRRMLLSFTGWTFSVRPVDIDERPLPGEPPSDYVLRLAEQKARAAGQYALPGQLILAADTTVADGEQILGKPADAAEAREMLRRLRNREHAVYTAIGVADAQAGRLLTDLSATRVWMRDYSDAEIEAYIASGDPFDKAGGYAIQNPDFHPVERIEGCYPCVVGLPVCAVVRTLAAFGLTPPVNVAEDCPTHENMGRPCPVYQRLMTVEQGDAGQETPGNSQN